MGPRIHLSEEKRKEETLDPLNPVESTLWISVACLKSGATFYMLKEKTFSTLRIDQVLKSFTRVYVGL